jgi:TM2 domain-containing membrane protein YozV
LQSKFFLSHFFFLIILISVSKANTCQSNILLAEFNQITTNQSELAAEGLIIPSVKKIKLITLLQNATVENKKVTAAILTLTLGMLGVHRIYLGTAPYIPAVYLFTFGGGFFVLPIIDLVMILTTNDITKFENNNKVLMWTGE